MSKRILAGACIGWAAIVGLAWWLAHVRIELCHKASFSAEATCAVRTTVARDHVLTSGLTVALVGAVAVAIMWSIVRERNVDRQAVIQPRSIPPEGNGLVTRPAPASPSFTWRAPRPRRDIVLAMVFGICLGGSLLWWGGMISSSQRPEMLLTGDAPERARAPSGNASDVVIPKDIALLPDGTQLEFPIETSDAVINRAVKQYLDAQAQPVEPGFLRRIGDAVTGKGWPPELKAGHTSPEGYVRPRPVEGDPFAYIPITQPRTARPVSQVDPTIKAESRAPH